MNAAIILGIQRYANLQTVNLHDHRHTPYPIISGGTLFSAPRRPSIELTREHWSVGNCRNSSLFSSDLAKRLKHELGNYTPKRGEERKRAPIEQNADDQ